MYRNSWRHNGLKRRKKKKEEEKKKEDERKKSVDEAQFEPHSEISSSTAVGIEGRL